MVTLVLHVFISKYPNICIIPYLSLFPEINFAWKATFTNKILLQGSIISQEVAIPGKLDIPGSHISLEVTFPRKSRNIIREVTFPGNSHFSQIFREATYFPGSRISRGDKFPGNFPGSHFSGKSDFSRKSHLPGSHKVPLVQPKIGIICQNLTIGEEEEGKKRLVDLRRLSLMASPQVKK